jgi:hypothetical protein
MSSINNQNQHLLLLLLRPWGTLHVTQETGNSEQDGDPNINIEIPLVNSSYCIGRDPKCDVNVISPLVSKRHVTIETDFLPMVSDASTSKIRVRMIDSSTNGVWKEDGKSLVKNKPFEILNPSNTFFLAKKIDVDDSKSGTKKKSQDHLNNNQPPQIKLTLYDLTPLEIEALKENASTITLQQSLSIIPSTITSSVQLSHDPTIATTTTTNTNNNNNKRGRFIDQQQNTPGGGQQQQHISPQTPSSNRTTATVPTVTTATTSNIMLPPRYPNTTTTATTLQHQSNNNNNEELTQLRTRIQTLEREKDEQLSLINQVLTTRKSLEEQFTKEVSDHANKITELERYYAEEMRKQRDNSEEILVQMKEEHASILRHQTNKLQTLEENLNQETNKRIELEQELNTIQLNFNREKKELQSKLSDQEIKLKTIANTTKDLETSKTRIELLNRELEKRVESLTDEKSMAISDLSKAKREHNALIKEYEHEIMTLKQSMLTKDTELTKLKQDRGIIEARFRDELGKVISYIDDLKSNVVGMRNSTTHVPITYSSNATQLNNDDHPNTIDMTELQDHHSHSIYHGSSNNSNGGNKHQKMEIIPGHQSIATSEDDHSAMNSNNNNKQLMNLPPPNPNLNSHLNLNPNPTTPLPINNYSNRGPKISSPGTSSSSTFPPTLTASNIEALQNNKKEIECAPTQDPSMMPFS